MADNKAPTPSLAPSAEPASPILKQGALPEPAEAPSPTAPAGAYKVIHGSVSFGNGQTAYPGATISLTAAEASLMLPLGVIEST
jgi:hypothetical protein